ncbi:MAG: T9SS type A sorting domain-containing protein [Bacteroidetes bacterium]|nr:T9SS type A sorting domain-containing protein [Bacteroidota bacterium]
MRKILLLISCLLVIPLQVLVAQAPKIIAYQYWFDDNDAGMISQPVSPATALDLTTSVNVPPVLVGLHRFNIRFKDDSLRYSPVSSSMFFYPVSTLVNGYEYWFNDNYAGKIAVAVSNTTLLDLTSAISSSALTPGMNTFHIRFHDVSGIYSAITSAYFVIMPEMLISGYEYWFDNDYGSKTSVNVASTRFLDLSSAISGTSLQLGFHAFHIRFKNTQGVWCSTQSDMFYKHGTENQNNLTSYEYWFDDNPAAKVSVAIAHQPVADLVATINAAALQPGLHKAHVRFQSGDLESIVSSGYFYKSATANIAENVISGYRYWFDNDQATMRVIRLAQPAGSMTLLDSVELPYLPLGKHMMSMEFRDTVGNYSSVSGDSVEVFTCQPYRAGNISGNSLVCSGMSGVAYSIPAILNATGYSWSLPPGATIVSGNNTRSVTVNFTPVAVSGMITVFGTNPCGSGIGRTLEISVTPPPVATISGDTVVCSGSTGVSYRTEAGNTGYAWTVTPGGTIAGGSGSNSVSVNWTAPGGIQTLTVSYVTNAGCSATKTIHVSVKPLPPSTRTLPGYIIPAGQTLCSDATATLIVSGGGTSPFLVQNGGSAILVAGVNIKINPGVVVTPGGFLHGYIASDCFYCNAVPHTLPQVLKEESFAGVSGEEPFKTTGDGFFKVYPNPTSGSFTLEMTGGDYPGCMVEMYSMHGEKLVGEQLPEGRKHELSLHDRPAGIYIIRVVSPEMSGTSRIMKY